MRRAIPEDNARATAELNGTLYRNGPNPQFDSLVNTIPIESALTALVHLGHRVPDGFHGNWMGRI